MSSSKAKPQTKKSGKGEKGGKTEGKTESKVVPTATDKALKYYPAEDESAPRKVCRS